MKLIIKLGIIFFILVSLLSCGTIDKKNNRGISSEPVNAALHCPANEMIKKYSYPGPAIEYTCCASNDFPQEIQAIAVDKLPMKVQGSIGKNESVKLFSSTNSCVKTSSLSTIEKIKISSRNCRTFVVYEHSPCSCTRGCACGAGGSRDWVCDCPGVSAGQLPVIGTQDSLRSKPELIGETTRECSSIPPRL